MGKKGNLAELQVQLELQSAAFNRGMDRVSKQINTFDKRTKKSTRSMRAMNKTMNSLARTAKTFGVALLAAFSVGAFKNAIEFADNIAKMSNALGFSVEQFQEFRHAAEIAGVASSQFESNMTAFVKRVGEAQAGMGPLVSGLKNLNPALLANLVAAENQAEAFEILVTAMDNATSATEKAAIANAAFSRAGVTMANLTVDGMRKGAEAAREMGIVLSDTTARKAEILQDRLTEMTSFIKTQFTTVLVDAGAAVAELFGTFTEQDDAEKALQRTLDKIIDVQKLLSAARERAATVGGNLYGDPGEVGRLTQELRNLYEAQISLQGQIKEFTKPSSGTGSGDASAAAMSDGLEEIELSAKRTGKSLVDMRNSIIDLQFPEVKVTAELMDDVDSFGTSVTTLLEELKMATDGFVSDFTNTIVDGLAEGTLAFEDFAKDVLKTLAKLFLNRMFTQFINTIPMFGGGGAGAGGGAAVGTLAATNEGGAVGVLTLPSYGFGAGRDSFGGYGDITINNNAPVDVEVKQNTTDQGVNLDILIENKVRQSIAGGGLDKAMRSSYGLGRRAF